MERAVVRRRRGDERVIEDDEVGVERAVSYFIFSSLFLRQLSSLYLPICPPSKHN